MKKIVYRMFYPFPAVYQNMELFVLSIYFQNTCFRHDLYIYKLEFCITIFNNPYALQTTNRFHTTYPRLAATQVRYNKIIRALKLVAAIQSPYTLVLMRKNNDR